jgi:hypothetical protein
MTFAVKIVGVLAATTCLGLFIYVVGQRRQRAITNQKSSF